MTILVRSGVVAASRRYAMELVRPTSIAFSGTSADIVGLGSVDFSAVTELSLNGVFSAEYDNYMISMRCTTSSAGAALLFRLRLAGTDNSTANSYTSQYIDASGTTVSAARPVGDFGQLGTVSSTQRNGQTIYCYGPNLAQPTAVRNIDASGFLSAYLVDRAVTHNQSTAYDGCTFSIAADNFTGSVAVYGLRG